MSLFYSREHARAVDKFYADNWVRCSDLSEELMNSSIDNGAKARDAKTKKAKEFYLMMSRTDNDMSIAYDNFSHRYGDRLGLL